MRLRSNFLQLTLRTMPAGFAYAMWWGVGFVPISLVAWRMDGQGLDAVAIIGMALMAAGLVVIDMGSNAAWH
jgi:small multidrug resistance pump